MKLSPLKYKSYTWPINPRTYSLRFEKNTAIHHYPYTNINEVDDTGMKPREVNGKGEFIGEGAYEEFQKLASIFYSKGPGLLIHPIWKIQQAIFNRLEVAQEPTPNYVKYNFGFIEHFSEVKVQEKKQVTFNTIDYGVILNGIADDVDEYWDDNGSKIEIGGRDKSMIFLENDAEPISLNKVIL